MLTFMLSFFFRPPSMPGRSANLVSAVSFNISSWLLRFDFVFLLLLLLLTLLFGYARVSLIPGYVSPLHDDKDNARLFRISERCDSLSVHFHNLCFGQMSWHKIIRAHKNVMSKFLIWLPAPDFYPVESFVCAVMPNASSKQKHSVICIELQLLCIIHKHVRCTYIWLVGWLWGRWQDTKQIPARYRR